MIATTIVAMAGAPLKSPGKLRMLVAPVIGVLLGAGFTPALFTDVAGWVTTLVLLPPFVVAAFAIAYFIYRRVGHYDHVTAFFSAAPGGLNDMMLMGAENGGNEAKIALAHASRILIVITCVVLFYSYALGARSEASERPFVYFLDLAALDYLWLFASGIIGAMIAPRIGLPAPIILGPMLASGAVHLSGLTSAAPPTLLVLVAQWVIGSSVGCRFRGTSFREIARDLGMAILASGAMLGCALAAAGGLTLMDDTSLIAAFLAFSPGGLFEMSLLALAVDSDGAYVATTHIIRIAIIIGLAPIVFQWLQKKS